eukprot:7391591-Prymnesium_polylepis.2
MPTTPLTRPPPRPVGDSTASRAQGADRAGCQVQGGGRAAQGEVLPGPALHARGRPDCARHDRLPRRLRQCGAADLHLVRPLLRRQAADTQDQCAGGHERGWQAPLRGEGCAELPAIGAELHKLQVAEWLLQDPSGNYCYIADGANSMQQEILAQILSRRNKETGKLESMAISLDAISDKSSEGQHQKYTAALEAIAEGWEEAAKLGLLDVTVEVETAEPPTAEPTAEPTVEPTAAPANATAFHAQRRAELRAKLRAKIAGLRAAASMNDRAAPARKAARLARGGDGKGGEGDVMDDPTCAHHAVANTGEEGRKAIDKLLKEKMNITEEQSESDSAKVKALRTNVGWFSSPACSLIYQVRAACPRPPPCCMTSSAWSPLASF